jgi:hypothetical protein
MHPSTGKYVLLEKAYRTHTEILAFYTKRKCISYVD